MMRERTTGKITLVYTSFVKITRPIGLFGGDIKEL
jgi:hypothetical protein